MTEVYINVDDAHYFSGREDHVLYWSRPEIIDAVVYGRTAWTEWTRWPLTLIRETVDLSGLKAAYARCGEILSNTN